MSYEFVSSVSMLSFHLSFISVIDAKTGEVDVFVLFEWASFLALVKLDQVVCPDSPFSLISLMIQ